MMQIHPTVIMGVSEHYSRVRANYHMPDLIIGALLGKKSDQIVEISDYFELCFIKATADVPGDRKESIVDREYYEKKMSMVKQVSPDLDVLGWYTTTTAPNATEDSERELAVSIHKQISEFVSNPILLRLDPYKRESDPKISGSLPLSIYEPVIDIDADGERPNFIEVPWTIATDDVEIIGLEHNAKLIPVEVTTSAAIDNLRLQYNAVKMLKDRIRVISKFVKDVQAGVLPYQEKPLADIARLSQKFPVLNTKEYRQAYSVQCNDVALNTYLGILTKGSMCKMNFGAPNSKTRGHMFAHARR